MTTVASTSSPSKSSPPTTPQVNTGKLPRVVLPKPNLKKNPTEYTNACAALNIKPNSIIVTNETSIVESEQVDLSGNYLGGKGFEAVTQLLVRNTNMRTLKAADNGLTNEAVVFFCRAMAHHPTLETIDLSNNTALSLPAGMALLELLHANQFIKDYKLQNTNIEAAVLNKIRRALNIRAKMGNPPRGSDGKTPYQRAVEAQAVRAAERRAFLREQRRNEEIERCALVETHVRQALQKSPLPVPPRGPNGWCALHVAISCTPGDFYSELKVIAECVIPALNKILASKKVFLVPICMHNDIDAHRYTKAASILQTLAVPVDYDTHIKKSTPFAVHLLGEKVGLSQYDPAVTEKDGIKNFNPVLYREYETSVKSLPCSIAMIRAPVASMHIPPAFVPRFSDDPRKVLPDEHSRLVRESIAAARGQPPAHGFFDVELEKAKWAEHVKFIAHVRNTHPEALLCEEYPATFDAATPHGDLTLKDLDTFEKLLCTRLLSCVETYLTASEGRCPTGSGTSAGTVTDSSLPRYDNQLPNARMATLLANAAEVGRKAITGKLDLYAVTPPSRNVALLHGPPGSGTTTTLRAFIQRCYRKSNYIVAHHGVRDVSIHAEPSDLRTMFLNLIYQLNNYNNTNGGQNTEKEPERLPSYILNEVHVERIRDYFTSTLARVAGDTSETKVIVLVIDGLDDLDEMVLPTSSLRVSDTGANIWDHNPGAVVTNTTGEDSGSPTTAAPASKKPAPPSAPRSASQGSTTAPSRHPFSAVQSPFSNKDDFSYIPVCLPKNVRIVGSCKSFSQAHRTLEMRGRDSCDPLPMTDLSDYEVEQYALHHIKESLQMDLPDAAVDVILAKEERHSIMYLRFVRAVCERYRDTPTSASLVTQLEALPHTDTECCTELMRYLELQFGESFTRKALTLLRLSRWGLTEVEFGELMARAAKPDGRFHQSIPGDLLTKFIRLISPVIQPLDAVPTPQNAVERVVYLDSRIFRQEAEARYAPKDTDGSIHQIMAHYYRKLMLVENHPLQAKALKECAYHTVCGKLWSLVDQWMLSVSFVSKGFQLGLGYQLLREYIRTYNTIETISFADCPERQVLLAKVKELVYFVRDHNINLTQFPWMAHQIAITANSETFLHRDAEEYFLTQQARMPHFVALGKSKAKTHRGPVTSTVFAPSGLRFASASDDRVIKIFNAACETLFTINHSSAKIKQLIYSMSSRYLVAVAEDRTVFSFDASNSNLVSKFQGHTSTINSVAISCRGRFIGTGSDDRSLGIWETETGQPLVMIPHYSFAHSSSPYGAVCCVTAHPTDEHTFFVACDRKILGWMMNTARDACEQILCVNAHATLPIKGLVLASEGSYIMGCAQTQSSVEAKAPAVEAAVKIWSVESGRHIASLMQPKGGMVGSTSVALSRDENTIVVAFVDGSVGVYRISWHSLAPLATSSSANAEPVTIELNIVYSAFRLHPVTRVTHIVFSHDSALVAVTGNMRQVKVFTLAPREEERKGLEIDGGAALAEYLLESQLTCIDWTENPQEGGPEVIAGDIAGRIHQLRLELYKKNPDEEEEGNGEEKEEGEKE